MDQKKSFVLHCAYQEQVDMLSDEQAGELFKALLAFASDGTEPDTDDCMVRLAFSFIAGQIQRDAKKYDEACKRRAESGKKGGRPKKQTAPEKKQKKQMVFEESKDFSEKAKKPDNEYVYDNDNDDDNVCVYDDVCVNDTVADTVCVNDTCAPSGAQEETHTQETHTLQQISALLSSLGYVWPQEEVTDFFEYNQRQGWKFRPETAARRWDQRRTHQRAPGRKSAPPMTQAEIDEMNDYLSLVN